ncbi:hypothetical protein IFN73_09740 [Francisella tularensis subsp. holarctica]|nr:hypothetical protein [Francisella tularensis subsp. holarctica]
MTIAGKHGKTATSTMTIKIIEKAGLNTRIMVGEVSSDFGISSRYTEFEYCVIDADESYTAFFYKRLQLINYASGIFLYNNI